VEHGEFPPADGGLSLVPQPDARQAAVLGFTGHIVVAADIDAPWLSRYLRPGELSEAFTPPFLGTIAGHLSRRVSAIDVVLLAPPASGAAELTLCSESDPDHPRVRRALRYRDDVTVWSTPGGVLILGRGLAGRWEVAVEVEPTYRGRGLGRALAAAARKLVPEGRPIWAQVAPGNAASVRAFLAAGYQVVGQEALLVTHGPG
jgi:GNAT superfamily N-acetyltransferase